MSEATAVPPALSTTQDTELDFAKVKDGSGEYSRARFGPHYMNREEISPEALRHDIAEYYSLEKLTVYLSETGENDKRRFTKIALQFPDELVADSPIIAQALQESLNNEDESNEQQIWILADTSYSPCCIDEVAAEHVSADIVVHFGEACLNPVEKISSAYVFGKSYLDIEKTVKSFTNTYSEKQKKICLMADVPYSHHLPELYRLLKKEYSGLIYTDVDFAKCGPNSTVIDKYEKDKGGSDEKSLRMFDVSRILRGVPSKYIEKHDGEDYAQITQDYDLFYIGAPADPKLLLLSTKFSEVTTVDPVFLETSHGTAPSLSRRYRFMMVARNASTIGILVNTLSLQNTRVLLNKVVKWIRNAGKKHYMFVVGKPNVAKLANFDTIDVWCVLGCGQSGIIIDSYGEYFKPIITPYELELALKPEVTWTGKWVTDFEETLKQDIHNSENEEDKEQTENTISDDDNDDDDEYAPEFDPVTGKLVSSRPLRQLKHLEIELAEQKSIQSSGDSTELSKRFTSALSIGNTVSTSALHLQNRSWTGLGSDYKNQEENGEYSGEGATLEEGRTGIARDYHIDGDTKKD
ncbi:hypothetical protein FOA43_003774 [Brettanomyces nanus]|uniref:2-(3-amino-3-carboxypropyl)histidine synthase subunit 2 n=1 Tax=Eeniella nana TaxID=13502 RepID=A0A875S805_EENNA|nr:uncharacterized protein FOA43_003774 [Brettanomyces nanus]QPG76385.1 hypothetical protein FOA43_003774 [Brettanomyces nanus]